MIAEDTLKSNNLRSYLLFWIGQVQSHLGSNIVQFVIIIWIAWEYDSPLFLGLAAFAGFAPLVLLTPLAGVLVDRWSHKKIIASMDFLQATATVILVYLFWIGDVVFWHILVLSFLRAVFEAFHWPASEAIMPLLVPKDKLSRMNGLTFLSYGVVGIIGPLVAAILLLHWEIYQILLLDPFTFIVAIIPVLVIRIPKVKKSTKKKTSFTTEFTEGLNFIKSRPGLLSLLSIFTAANFFLMPLFILLPLFVKQVHHGGKTDLALVLASQQIGLFLGSLLMSTWKGFENKMIAVVFGILFMYIGFLIVIFTPIGPYSFLIMGLGMVLLGFMMPVANVASQSIWQSVVPPEKIGRVFSVRRSIAQCTAPIAMMASGVLGEIISIQTLFFACLALGLACLTYTWFMTNLPDVERTVVPSEVPVPI